MIFHQVCQSVLTIHILCSIKLSRSPSGTR
jgi:hypothetical protein